MRRERSWNTNNTCKSFGMYLKSSDINVNLLRDASASPKVHRAFIFLLIVISIYVLYVFYARYCIKCCFVIKAMKTDIKLDISALRNTIIQTMIILWKNFKRLK